MEGGNGAAAAGVGGVVMIVYLAIILLMVISMWKVFSKAGKPGWAILIPIYNTIVMIQIAGKPIWWFLLLLIPLVNVVISILLLVEIAKRFGKGGGFVAGLILLPIIFWPILGFGSAQYQEE